MLASHQQVVIPGKGTCSGVLVTPLLVLTAAHCLCLPDKIEANKTYTYRQGRDKDETVLKCSTTANVGTVLYTPLPSPSRQEGMLAPSAPRQAFYKDPVNIQIREGYWFQTDAQGGIARSEMDLAVIHLVKPLAGVAFDNNLPRRDVQPGEFFVAVGYGPTENAVKGTRHFGTAKVMNLATPVGGDEVFTFGKPEVLLRVVRGLSGDSGGPCFREDEQGRWLIGIISRSVVVDDLLVTGFTSLFRHRDWINRQQRISEESAERIKKNRRAP